MHRLGCPTVDRYGPLRDTHGVVEGRSAPTAGAPSLLNLESQILFHDAAPYTDTMAIMSVGDRDDDGATEVITLSGSLSCLEPDPGPMLHIHYGVHVPPVAPAGTR